MISRKELKKKAKWSVKEHLGIWIILCAVAMFLYGEEIFTNSITLRSTELSIEDERRETAIPDLSESEGLSAPPAQAETDLEVISQESDLKGRSVSIPSRYHAAASIYENAVSALNSSRTVGLSFGSAATEFSGFSRQLTEILWNLSENNDDENRAIVDESIQQSVEHSVSNRILGRSRGVLSDLVNRITSGSFLLSLGMAIRSIVGSGSISSILLILLGFAVMFAFWMFVTNTYKVLLARMFLEGRLYDVIHLNRTLFLVRTKSWMRASIVMLLTTIYQLLWNLTIIGGIIKYYSYHLVPYIVAENPKLSAKEAITLSRDLMNGHKWECCKLQWSFIGWEILNVFTFGLLRLLFIRPYQEAVYCEYYSVLRRIGKENGIPNSELLNDTYLHELPDDALLSSTYSDVLDALRAEKEALEHTDTAELHGLYWFLMEAFGLTIRSRKAEQEYAKRHARTQRLYFEEEAYEKKIYPMRLCPTSETEMLQSFDTISALRSYSVWSVILIFFMMSFAGWLWEVSLHLVSYGDFVNRGVLHGPWLPIYGAGGALILIILYRFRRNPLAEFVMIIILCGAIEYATSYYLEAAMGKRWWDYTGYFLNIHGRICAEGLLVFGVGGMAIVYFLAPMLDDLFKKLPPRRMMILCMILITLFVCDQLYSGKHPNQGEGITSVQSSGADDTAERTGRIRI